MVKDKDIDNNTASQAINEAFMAFVDAIIPRTLILAQIYGEVMFYGALDQEIDKYLEMNLMIVDDSYVRMTVGIFNQAAKRYIVEEGADKIYKYYRMNKKTRQKESMGFSDLPRRDRFRALSTIEQIDGLLIRLVMFGYYSEWYGYGTTRFKNPDHRILEAAPLSWQQSSYPGPSLSYLEEVREYNAIRKFEI